MVSRPPPPSTSPARLNSWRSTGRSPRTTTGDRRWPAVAPHNVGVVRHITTHTTAGAIIDPPPAPTPPHSHPGPPAPPSQALTATASPPPAVRRLARPPRLLPPSARRARPSKTTGLSSDGRGLVLRCPQRNIGNFSFTAPAHWPCSLRNCAELGFFEVTGAPQYLKGKHKNLLYFN